MSVQVKPTYKPNNRVNLANQAAQNQMAQFNVGNLQQAGLASQAAANQAAQFGAQAGNVADLSNQAAQNQMAQFNAQQLQQAGLSTQAAANQPLSLVLALRTLLPPERCRSESIGSVQCRTCNKQV
jgi:hypothetical protein